MPRRGLFVLLLVGLLSPPLGGGPAPKKPTPDEVRKRFYRCWLELERVDSGRSTKDPFDLCGLRPPDGPEGRSLVPLLKRPAAA